MWPLMSNLHKTCEHSRVTQNKCQVRVELCRSSKWLQPGQRTVYSFMSYSLITWYLVTLKLITSRFIIGIEYIKQCLPMLQYLDISQNSIGDDGLRHIMESLESSNSMLTELHMQRCHLSTKGMYIYSIVVI